ncbi:MAG TPA: hypothetical protein VHW06_12540 [Streptosporangiaceae bacterium]|nr:hypothetical protein [Streptosporangiaceae bacterium]
MAGDGGGELADVGVEGGGQVLRAGVWLRSARPYPPAEEDATPPAGPAAEPARAAEVSS